MCIKVLLTNVYLLKYCMILGDGLSPAVAELKVLSSTHPGGERADWNNSKVPGDLALNLTHINELPQNWVRIKSLRKLKQKPMKYTAEWCSERMGVP